MQSDTIDVLVPTCERPAALAMTLTALAAQTFAQLRIVISDQSERLNPFDTGEVRAVLRLLSAQGRPVDTLRHLPRRGMAEQRAFLLSRAEAPLVLFLDDDVLLEPDLVERLHRSIRLLGCGFVGSAVHGLSYLSDIRPEQETIEFWSGPVAPERVTAHGAAWSRHHLHRAANLFHVQARLGLQRDATRHYRVAWVGGCVLFDTGKLRAAGGFAFWRELPKAHGGEDALAQLRVMERYGGCAIIPSGAYHMELPTTMPAPPVNAAKVLLGGMPIPG